MAIVSIAIRTDVLAVASGSGPREMLPGSLGTSILVSYIIFPRSSMFGSMTRTAALLIQSVYREY